MNSTPDAARLVEKLREVSRAFGRSAAAEKTSLLKRCSESTLKSARVIRNYHDTLLFLAAYPDNAAARSLVEAELNRLAASAARLTDRRHNALADTGIAGTTVESAFSIDTLAWLCDRYPHDVEVAWVDGSAGPGLDALLWLFVTSAEKDGLFAATMTTQQWVRDARGHDDDDDDSSDLAWIVRQLRRLPAAPDVLDELLDKADIRVRWRLNEPSASITLARFPARRTYYQRDAPIRNFELTKVINRKPPAARPLSPREATRLIDTARAVLAARQRETDPITYANPREVTLFRLERGVDIVLFGMLPGRRLPVESFFGYLLARNGAPAAYGGGWVFFDRIEIGVNVFEQFRGGESAHLFAEILRVYRHHFKARCFRVDPYQFGAENEDAIKTGAFWFYYRLGFRPTDDTLARLAADEWERIAADRTHRTPLATLRRLATSQLAVSFDGPFDGGPNLVDLGMAVTKMIGEKFGGDRAKAEQWSRARMAHLLPGVTAREGAQWPEAERSAFDRHCVLTAMIPDLTDWSASDRRKLAAWMRAKGSPRERDYALKAQRIPRLRDALAQLARTGG